MIIDLILNLQRDNQLFYEKQKCKNNQFLSIEELIFISKLQFTCLKFLRISIIDEFMKSHVKQEK